MLIYANLGIITTRKTTAIEMALIVWVVMFSILKLVKKITPSSRE